MSPAPRLVLALVSISCAGCVASGGTLQPNSFTADLGYKGCAAYGPLTSKQVSARAAELAIRMPDPSLDALATTLQPDDHVYYFSCTSSSLSGSQRIVEGTVFFGLVRGHAVVAKAAETILD